MAVEELNGEVRFSTHLPYPNNLSRSGGARAERSACLSPPELLFTLVVVVVVQDDAGPHGESAAADADVGPGLPRRNRAARLQEAQMLRGAGEDPEHEGEEL